MKASIEEQWGILLKGKDIKTIQRNYEKIIKEYNKQIINNLIKLQEIVNNSKTNKDIFELESDYYYN